VSHRWLSLVAAVALAPLAGCGPDPTVGSVCTSGEYRCLGNVYEVCADDGEGWNTVQDCSAGGEVCTVGPGCVTCFAGSLSCDGFDILRCRGDGSGSDLVGSCDPAASEVCSGGTCIDACALAAENHSYEGCEYWAVDLDNAVVANQGAASAQQFSVVLSNASQLASVVTIDIYCTAEDAANPAIGCTEGMPFAVNGPFNLLPGALAVVDLDPREVDGASRPELNDGPGTFRSRHAYRISGTAPLIAYQFNPLENVNVFSNDASLLLPTSGLGTSYLVLSWPQTLALTDVGETNGGIDLRAFLTIVGGAEATTVRITLTTDIIGGADIPATPAGSVLELTVGRYEVVNLETGGFNADFTGTYVVADKPVAVFTGSEASDVPRFDTFATRQCCADHLEEQLFPEQTFGTHFAAVKSPLRSPVVESGGWDVSVVPDEPEWWRVIATAEQTVVTTTLPPPNNAFLLDRGESAIFESERDFTVTASDAVAFAQFPGGQQTTGIPSTLEGGIRPPGGDPSMILIPPVEQWRSRYLFLVPNKYAYDFLLIAAPSDAELIYDGLPIDSALVCAREPIGILPAGAGGGDVELLAMRCQLSYPTPDGPGLQDDGVHLLETLGGEQVGLVVWGWDSFVSYGYPGGSNVTPINLE
jgi:IgGFc binding protein